MSNERHRSVLLFGAPGVGKGTQGKILGTIPGFCHMSTGDAFRALDPESELGKTFKEYSTRGELVPDDFTIRLWRQYMADQERAGRYTRGSDLLVLDGIPRSIAQAELMADDLDVLKIMHLTAADEEAMIARLRKRALEQGRPDDGDEDVIRNRWRVYRAETEPVLGHYSKDLIAEVDAVGTPAQVLQRILAVIAPIA